MTDHLKSVCDNWEVDDAGYTQLAALTRDCIFAIHSLEADEDIPVGASKYGGNPDVVTPFDWPHSENGPLWFTCQINLAELPTQLGVLPSSGLLSFFFDEAHSRAGNGSMVLYQRQTNELSRIPVVADPRHPDIYEQHFFARSLSFRQGKSLPWSLPEALRDLENELEDYISFFYEYQDIQTDEEEFHQLLGLPFGMPFNIDAFPAMHDWQLLLQLTGQNDNIYFLMQDSDLRERRFPDAAAYFGCT